MYNICDSLNLTVVKLFSLFYFFYYIIDINIIQVN